MKNRILNLVGLLLICVPLLKAQTQERVEFKADEANGSYNVITVGDEGLIIAYTPADAKRNSNSFKCVKLGTDFKEQKTVNINLLPGYDLISNTKEGNNVYMLFADNSSEFKDYSVVQLNAEDMTYHNFNGNFVKSIFFKELKVTGGVVYVGGTAGPPSKQVSCMVMASMCLCFIPLIFYHPKYFPYVAAIDMNKKAPSKKDFIMDGYEKGSAVIIDLTTQDSANVCNMLMIHKTKKTSSTFLKEVNNYKLSKDIPLKFPENKEPNRGKINVVDNRIKLIAGTYGLSNKYSSRAAASTSWSAVAQGIYFGQVTDTKQNFMTLLPFTSFKKFKMTSESAVKKSKKSAKKGKEDKVLVMINVNFHDFLVREDETLLFGEVYYPTYHTEYYTTYDAQGHAHTSTRVVFDGFKWKGALVIAFDKAGKMKWENGFEIKSSPVSFNPSYKFRFVEQEDGGIKILYCDNNTIQSKIIYNGTESENQKDIKIKSSVKSTTKTKVATNNDVNGVEYWFDENYLAYGIQRIKKEKKAKGKTYKTVFYLNKVEIE